ncbi:MAG: hypothetical protein V4671_08165 [Armatimonadota bacterium]
MILTSYQNQKAVAFLTFCCFPLLCGSVSVDPPSKSTPVTAVTAVTEEVVYTKWGNAPDGNPRKVTLYSGGHRDWFSSKRIKTVSDLEAASKLIVVVRPREDITERQQLLLFHEDGDTYPDLGYSVAQVEVVKVIKKPAGFRMPSSGMLPICEPSFIYPHPEAGPDGLVLDRMVAGYREMKKGEAYLLFLTVEPKDDIKRNAGILYGVVEPHLGKYNLGGGDPQDDVVDVERAKMLRDRLPVAQRGEWKAPVSQKAKWKNIILRRYAAHLR